MSREEARRWCRGNCDVLHEDPECAREGTSQADGEVPSQSSALRDRDQHASSQEEGAQKVVVIPTRN